MPALWMIIPLYNEAPNIPSLLDSIASFEKSLGHYTLFTVFSDDGSRDGTALELSAADVFFANRRIIRSEMNLGPGHAAGKAFEFIAERLRPDDIVMTIEGDNSCGMSHAHAMIRFLKQGSDAVFADPWAPGGALKGVPGYRRLLSRAANSLAGRLFPGASIKTFNHFFRVYKGSLIMRLQEIYGPSVVESKGFEWAFELFCKIHLCGGVIASAVTLTDWKMRRGASKMKVLTTCRRYLTAASRYPQWKRRARAFSKPVLSAGADKK